MTDYYSRGREYILLGLGLVGLISMYFLLLLFASLERKKKSKTDYAESRTSYYGKSNAY